MGLEKELSGIIRRVVREENEALLEALRRELYGIYQPDQIRRVEPEKVVVMHKKAVNKERNYEDNNKAVSSSVDFNLIEQENFLDFRQAWGVRKHTIEEAKIVAKCLQKHDSLRLKQIKSELKKHGRKWANGTNRMQAIMKICPAIKKAGHTYQPD